MADLSHPQPGIDWGIDVISNQDVIDIVALSGGAADNIAIGKEIAFRARTIMSQRAVEAVLGRLITDVDFRVRFFASPERACAESELSLTQRETAALLRVDVGTLQQIAVRLDPKIVRAAAVGDAGGAPGVKLPAQRAGRQPQPQGPTRRVP